ncbi:MAG TPA: peptidoglycan DD-metalloendopeptidase family protein [Solirubrobacterales bacterium]|nr:peptidoglycan DD-metalloendopeptidase family protein [Solirubrobacterales bacterium]
MASIASLAACAGTAGASTGGAPTPGGSPPPPGSSVGAPATAPSAGAISIASAATTPRKSFYFGYRYPRLTYTIESSQPQNDLRIDVLNATGEAIKTFYREDVAPNVADQIRWDGTAATGRPAPNGHYSFRIAPQTATAAARRSTTAASLQLSFAFYGYAFPVLGQHEFGMGAGRFGAPRSGHTHQGQDVMAACGTPLLAARGGAVQYAGYEGNAGNYIVIDGKGTADDFMYAHLAEPSPLQTGDTVRTGQPIGIVGDTGDAQGCHLHFEMWGPPGWYEGGSPFDPLPYLEKWDAYS